MNRPVFQRGFLIIAAMALLVIVSFLVLALGFIFTGDVTSSAHMPNPQRPCSLPKPVSRSTPADCSPQTFPARHGLLNPPAL